MKQLLVMVLILLALTACDTGSVRQHDRQSTTIAVAEPNAVRANALAFRALSLVGTPYVYGGSSPETGFDCSGFMMYLYRDAIAVALRRTAAEQSNQGRLVRMPVQLRLGDLLFFRENGVVFHVGMYVGEGRFVHAPRTGKNVELTELKLSYWQARFAFARRMI
jgi:cell wall-associated NlpC family hydrolase